MHTVYILASICRVIVLNEPQQPQPRLHGGEFLPSSEIPGTGRIRTHTADLCVTTTDTEEEYIYG